MSALLSSQSEDNNWGKEHLFRRTVSSSEVDPGLETWPRSTRLATTLTETRSEHGDELEAAFDDAPQNRAAETPVARSTSFCRTRRVGEIFRSFAAADLSTTQYPGDHLGPVRDIQLVTMRLTWSSVEFRRCLRSLFGDGVFRRGCGLGR